MLEAMAGKDKTQIAKDLNLDRTTVRRILSEPEVAARVQEGYSRCIELIPKAVDAVETDLEKGNGNLGIAILKGVGVLRDVPVINLGFQFDLGDLPIPEELRAKAARRVIQSNPEAAPVS